MKSLREYVRTVPDFPKPGILFRDVVPLIENPEAFRRSIATLKEEVSRWGSFTKIAAVEARGFIFGAPLALELNVGFVPLRKPGKLPSDVLSVHYELEYGSNTIEMQKDSISRSDRVLLIDDLLATGGTIAACRKLVENQGAEVAGAAFLIELVDLCGREKIKGIPVFAPIQFEGL